MKMKLFCIFILVVTVQAQQSSSLIIKHLSDVKKQVKAPEEKLNYLLNQVLYSVAYLKCKCVDAKLIKQEQFNQATLVFDDLPDGMRLRLTEVGEEDGSIGWRITLPNDKWTSFQNKQYKSSEWAVAYGFAVLASKHIPDVSEAEIREAASKAEKITNARFWRDDSN